LFTIKIFKNFLKNLKKSVDNFYIYDINIFNFKNIPPKNPVPHRVFFLLKIYKLKAFKKFI